MYGPSALGGSFRRFLALTMTLARTEFKLRYFGSVLGYVWSLMRPLLFFGVLYVFFVKIIQIARGAHYGVYLLTGIVLWTFFAEATGNCVSCLVTREALLRKIRFPRMAIPLSVSLTSIFNLSLNLVVVVVFALADGVTPRLSWLEMIPIVLGFVVLGTGFGMLLSTLYVRFRDVQPIWDVVLQAWFYGSPIMYTAYEYGRRFGVGFAHFALLSPPAMLLSQMGHTFIDRRSYPSAATAAHSDVTPVVAAALIACVFALGWWVFTRRAPRVAEEL
jgi:ABC-2 type transport system permease protein